MISFGEIGNNTKSIYDLTGMHVYVVTEVEESDDCTTVSLVLETKDKVKKFERFNVTDERGLKAFFGFCKAALGEVPKSLDCSTLLGKFVKFECERNTYVNKTTLEEKRTWQKKKGTYYEQVSEEEKFGTTVEQAEEVTETIPDQAESSTDVEDILSQL